MRCIKQVNQVREGTGTVVVVVFFISAYPRFDEAMIVVMMGRGVWVARLGIVAVFRYR